MKYDKMDYSNKCWDWDIYITLKVYIVYIILQELKANMAMVIPHILNHNMHSFCFSFC